jgi:hypothetical protein
MPLSKAKDADRKRKVRSVAFRAQAAAKQIAQGVVQPTNEAKRKRREREDAEERSVASPEATKKRKLQDAERKRREREDAEGRSVAFSEAAEKRKLQDADRKRREREDAAQAQAAKKQKLQGAVVPTSDAERKKKAYEPSSEAHGGSREHTGRPRELSRGLRAYENMVAVATIQPLLWDAQNADAAVDPCAPVKLLRSENCRMQKGSGASEKMRLKRKMQQSKKRKP